MFIFGYIIHLIFGVFAAKLTAYNPDQFIMCLIGSLMPDIDHPRAFIGKFNPLAGIMKHRGWTHTVLGCALLSLLALPIGAYLAMLAGCLSHIIADKISSTLNGRAWKIKLY